MVLPELRTTELINHSIIENFKNVSSLIDLKPESFDIAFYQPCCVLCNNTAVYTNERVQNNISALENSTILYKNVDGEILNMFWLDNLIKKYNNIKKTTFNNNNK